MGAVEQPEVAVREPSWNEGATATTCENVGVRERVWNQAAKRKTGVERVFGVNAAVTVRERVEKKGT
jgi:hypothetical protein